LAVHAILTSVDDGIHSFNETAGRKSILYDMRSHNIDKLRCALGRHDWSFELSCFDYQTVYDNFVYVLLSLIKQCIPVKTVRLGRQDPDFVTPLIKNLLKKQIKIQIQMRNF
jgi:hypothetical protein